jgi:XTP/dITP diphosphohydrolase
LCEKVFAAAMLEFGVEFPVGDVMLARVTTTLFLATRNRHKADEIRGILGEGFSYLTPRDFPDAPVVAEDAGTFEGNAAKKAVEFANWLGARQSSRRPPRATRLFALADDSGLEVDALQGAPGVHSARFAAVGCRRPGNCSDADNNAKLLRLLKDAPADQRTARFRCVIALATVRASPAGLRRPQMFEGVCEGRIGLAPRGSEGFGYDPLFLPAGFEQTFAECGVAVKSRLSHRARALAQVRRYLEAERGCDSIRAAGPPSG